MWERWNTYQKETLKLTVISATNGKQLNSMHTEVTSSYTIHPVCFDWLIRNTFMVQHQPNCSIVCGKCEISHTSQTEPLS